jgi:type IV secretion system protein VirD4
VWFCRLLLILAVLLVVLCAVLLTAAWPWFGVIIFFAVAYRKRGWLSSAYGSARWADAKDLKGMIGAGYGLILGRMRIAPPPLLTAAIGLFRPRLSSIEACSRFLRALRRKWETGMVRMPHAVHTAVFAPTGAGKGVSFVVPHLLTCPDSMVVVDFKGELARTTAEHRRKAFGHRTVLLDPFGVVTRESDSFNPLDWIDPAEETSLDECRDLAEALVLRTGQEKEPHWADSAEIWIAAMTALVVAIGEPGNRSLQTIRSLLTNTGQMENAIKAMTASEAWSGMLARLGHQLTHFKDKELGSVLTTTNRFSGTVSARRSFVFFPPFGTSTRASGLTAIRSFLSSHSTHTEIADRCFFLLPEEPVNPAR